VAGEWFQAAADRQEGRKQRKKQAEQMSVAFFHFHDTGVRVARTFPLGVGRLLSFAFTVELPQVVVVMNLDAFGLGEPSDIRFPVLAGVLPHDRLHRRIGFQQSRIHAHVFPFSSPCSSTSESTNANTCSNTSSGRR
jgi:hypothetical protein